MSSEEHLQKVERRIQKLEAFLETAPGDTFSRFALALEYLKAERTDEAEKIFVDIAENQPGYSGVYYHLGKLYEGKGRYDDAFATYSSGIEVCQHQQELHALKELKEAQMMLRQALDDD